MSAITEASKRNTKSTTTTFETYIINDTSPVLQANEENQVYDEEP